MHPYVLYVIFAWAQMSNGNCIKTYIGITNNLNGRLKKHRGLLKGGAKFTTRYTNVGAEWTLAGLAHGFASHQEVLKVEWALQNPNKSKHFKTRQKIHRHDLAGILDNLIFLSSARSHSHIWVTLHNLPTQTRQDLQFKGLVDLHSHSEPNFYNSKAYLEFTSATKPHRKSLEERKKKPKKVNQLITTTATPKKQQHQAPAKLINAKKRTLSSNNERLSEKFKADAEKYAQKLALLERTHSY